MEMCCRSSPQGFRYHVMRQAGDPWRTRNNLGGPAGPSAPSSEPHPPGACEAMTFHIIATFLGLEPWQFSRARTAGLIPAPGCPRGRWSAEVAYAALARIGEIVLAVGAIPDIGATRAAEILSARLGVIVSPAGVAELSRRGLLPEVGSFREWTLYDGRAIEAFADLGLAQEASGAGEMRTADAAAGYLQIRRSDFDHLTRTGLLRPADWAHGPFDSRHRFSVPLYRTADLDAAAADARIDWAAVRSTPLGRRSPLARLAAASDAEVRT
jgi:hypothetical protein